MTKTMTKETELLALVEDYQNRIARQEDTIRELKEKNIVLEKTIDVQNTEIEVERSQNRQLLYVIDMKEDLIKVRDLLIEELKKKRQ